MSSLSSVSRNHGPFSNGSSSSSSVGSPRVVDAVTVLTQEIFGRKDAEVQTEDTILGSMPKFVVHGAPVTPTIVDGAQALTEMGNHRLSREIGYESDGSNGTNSSIVPPGASLVKKKVSFARRPEEEAPQPKLKRNRVGSYVPSSRASSSSSSSMESTQRKINTEVVNRLIPIGTFVKKDRSEKKYVISGFFSEAGDVPIREVARGALGPLQAPFISAHVSQLKPWTKTGIVLLQDLTTDQGKFHGLVKINSLGKNGLLEGNWVGFGGTPLNKVSTKGRDLLGLIPMNVETVEEAEEILEGVSCESVPWKPYEGAEDLYGKFYKLFQE